MRENSENLNIQAIELAFTGDYPEAIACLKRALSIDKENHLLWYNLGVTYRNSGNLQSAKESLLNAAALDNMDDEVIGTLALVCYGLNQYEESLAYYMEALELNDENAQNWNNLGVLHFSAGEYEQACEAFEEAVIIDPNYYDAVFNLRDVYGELGNEAGVAACSERLQSLQPPLSDYR